MTVAGFTSTGSKRPDLLFGGDLTGLPQRMTGSRGCTVRGADGREYLDFLMGLGAVALGYGDPLVDAAAIEAVRRGTIGALAPQDEADLAAELRGVMPWLAEVRFLKTGAEAVAASVRLARTVTGRNQVLGCGYHGWLDWCSASPGVPAAVRADFAAIPFNDSAAAEAAIRGSAARLACVVIEPVIDGAPSVEWLRTLRSETARAGAVLIFDEVKTAFRLAIGGATERWGVTPDLTVIGKALANGFPLGAVGGSHEVMRHVRDTWISSTMATEYVSLAAARATLAVMTARNVPAHLERMGTRLFAGLETLVLRHPVAGSSVRGVPQMCYLHFPELSQAQRIAAECARHGLLFKGTAYNFVSLAHDEAAIDRALTILDDVLARC
jgi:glutamate-1-semialdehyde 2,1-aminomutase